MSLRGLIFVSLLWPLLATFAAGQGVAPTDALRSAVPILCTENRMAAHTRVRGTGVIVDSGGSLITAAHVIAWAREDCTLSVLVPDREWRRVREMHTFFVYDCKVDQPLDLAACRLRPELPAVPVPAWADRGWYGRRP